MKRILRKITCAAMALVMSVGVVSFCASALLGDINDSNKTNSADARLLLRYSAKLETIDEEHLRLCDFNCDGKVNSSDARTLLRAAAKVEDLEHFTNYYMEMAGDAGFGGSFARLNGAYFIEASMTGINMAMLFETNGDIIFIDHEGQRYGVLTVSDQKALSDLMAAQGGESLDFKGLLNEALAELPELDTPAKLLEDGFEKSAGEWEGQAADVYTDGKETYYFSGRTLLASITRTGVASFKNFTESPAPYIYAYRNYGYKEVDFMELMMSMADMPGLF